MSGILLQLPTPDHIDGSHLTTLIDPAKDVDGLTPVSAGLLAKGLPGLRPCTPAGVIELLRRYDVALEGAEAVVVGRSDLVGKPVAALLLAENATVTICHSRTRDLAGVCRRADVLIAAVGRPEMVKGDWVKPGATVIDVGINRTDAGLVGDVEFAVGGRGGRSDHAGARRGRADDDRDAAAQHAAGRAGPGRAARRPDALRPAGELTLKVPWSRRGPRPVTGRGQAAPGPPAPFSARVSARYGARRLSCTAWLGSGDCGRWLRPPAPRGPRSCRVLDAPATHPPAPHRHDAQRPGMRSDGTSAEPASAVAA